MFFILHRSQFFAILVNIFDGRNNLAHLLIVAIFALDFIFKVLFESLILELNFLNLSLKTRHILLLFIQLSSHFSKLLSLVHFDFLHALVDFVFALVQLFVFVFQINEAAAQIFNRISCFFIVGR